MGTGGRWRGAAAEGGGGAGRWRCRRGGGGGLRRSEAARVAAVAWAQFGPALGPQGCSRSVLLAMVAALLRPCGWAASSIEGGPRC
jgi:hypothetical protein